MVVVLKKGKRTWAKKLSGNEAIEQGGLLNRLKVCVWRGGAVDLEGGEGRRGSSEARTQWIVLQSIYLN